MAAWAQENVDEAKKGLACAERQLDWAKGNGHPMVIEVTVKYRDYCAQYLKDTQAKLLSIQTGAVNSALLSFMLSSELAIVAGSSWTP